MRDFPTWSVAWIIATAIAAAGWLRYMQYRDDKKNFEKTPVVGCECKTHVAPIENPTIPLFTDAELNQMIHDERVGVYNWEDDEVEQAWDKQQALRQSEERVEQLKRQESQIRGAWRDGNSQPRRSSSR